MSGVRFCGVSAAAAAAPSGVVTFLFTDVEGATRRWEADADSTRAALAAHDKLLRNAIEANGGWLFKHTGDGVCAAFSSPKSAVDAAVAAQQALEFSVRMGIATGEAELRDGDYFGAVLNRAARVMAAGHGGQILLAESTAGLLSGVDLLDLGPRRLRDVPTPVGMFQVRAAGLRTEFAPRHALLDAHDAVVRSQLARFRGREVNTSGDGFLAMFDGPQRAIRCAIAIRDAVQALGIEVRAGLHTGECEVRGDDIGGIAVHIGARVAALAKPNDVLVSSTLRDLVIGSGLEFENRGAHELKGVPGEWHLLAVAS